MNVISCEIPEKQRVAFNSMGSEHVVSKKASSGSDSNVKINFAAATAKKKIEDLLEKSYGLCHVDVLVELKTIVTSDVDSRTLFYDDDH